MATMYEIERAETLLALSDVILAETESLLNEAETTFCLRFFKRISLLRQIRKLLDEHGQVMDEIHTLIPRRNRRDRSRF